MNVGQILETHMGWACRGLGRIIDEALQQFHASGQAKQLRDAMAPVYGKDEFKANIKDDELVEIADKLTKGVPIATPVFDGAQRARHRRDAEARRLRHRRAR